MTNVIVKNYRINGYYQTLKSPNFCYFEKEVRGVSPEDAVTTVKNSIASQHVDPKRIVIEKVYEIKDPEHLKSRVIKAFTTENLRI
nr:hypothetical protein [Candidatus Sigynarchaeota archaeon]